MSLTNRKQQLLNMLENEPKDVFLNYALAMELLAENNFEEAKIQLEKVLIIKPDYLPCFYQLGQVSEKLSLLNEAIVYYQKGLELAKIQLNMKAMGELNEALWFLED